MNLLKEKIGEHSERVIMGDGNFPIIGIVGLCHGNEPVGRVTLDKLQTELGELKKGQVHLIYANLAAEEITKSQVDKNLNIAFPGKPNGNIEERIAYNLRGPLEECHFVLDIHSMSEDCGTFAISTAGLSEAMVNDILQGGKIHETTLEAYKDSGVHTASRRPTNVNAIAAFAQNTGLPWHVQMKEDVARGRSLIDYVNSHGKGYGISFEAGEHTDPNSEVVAMRVARNVLMSYGVINGEPEINSDQEIVLGLEAVQLPAGVSSEQFTSSEELGNFKPLAAGVAYGHDHNGNNYSLSYDCVPILFNPKTRNGEQFRSGRVFIPTQKIS
ncbi:hypothetical protein HOC32_05705 [Candidatus Woesearchaeota archaeon]|jgi:predicted deacylase|nr:hypothetical protein [Candidatus Woesearchaeota archaeon]